jgi:predicted RNA binding protein YcfA (HicA-like mRNA interferase family)
MGRTEKLYQKALRSPNNFSFRDLCLLAERVGFQLKPQGSGSHKFYYHPVIKQVVNFQPFPSDSKKAKHYQVKQLIDIITKYNLIEGEK